jgi:hypothetical protein
MFPIVFSGAKACQTGGLFISLRRNDLAGGVGIGKEVRLFSIDIRVVVMRDDIEEATSTWIGRTR